MPDVANSLRKKPVLLPTTAALVLLLTPCASQQPIPAKTYQESVSQISTAVSATLRPLGNIRVGLLAPVGADDIGLEIGLLVVDQLAATLIKEPHIELVPLPEPRVFGQAISRRQKNAFSSELFLEYLAMAQAAEADILIATRAGLAGPLVSLTTAIVDVNTKTTLGGVAVRMRLDEHLHKKARRNLRTWRHNAQPPWNDKSTLNACQPGR